LATSLAAFLTAFLAVFLVALTIGFAVPEAALATVISLFSKGSSALALTEALGALLTILTSSGFALAAGALAVFLAATRFFGALDRSVSGAGGKAVEASIGDDSVIGFLLKGICAQEMAAMTSSGISKLAWMFWVSS